MRHATDDVTLVVLAQRGDAHAFAVLADRHGRSLYATAMSIVGSSWDAADVVQDSLASAFTRLDRLRDPACFRSWMTSIVVNRCRDVYRKTRRERLSESPLEGEAYEFQGPEIALELMDALRMLDEDARTVVALRYFRDLKVADIAVIVGCPEGTVKSRLNRALTALRGHLERENRLEVI